MAAKGCCGAALTSPPATAGLMSRRQVATGGATVLNVEEELEDEMTPDRQVRAMSATFHNTASIDKTRDGDVLSEETPKTDLARP